MSERHEIIQHVTDVLELDGHEAVRRARGLTGEGWRLLYGTWSYCEGYGVVHYAEELAAYAAARLTTDWLGGVLIAPCVIESTPPVVGVGLWTEDGILEQIWQH